MQELADLKQASTGSTADKIRYFDNCVRRKLQELNTAAPADAAPFTWHQKRKLSVACSQLPESHCTQLLEILAQHSGKNSSGEGEIVVDIGSLPDAALHAMQVRAFLTKLHTGLACLMYQAVTAHAQHHCHKAVDLHDAINFAHINVKRCAEACGQRTKGRA